MTAVDAFTISFPSIISRPSTGVLTSRITADHLHTACEGRPGQCHQLAKPTQKWAKFGLPTYQGIQTSSEALGVGSLHCGPSTTTALTLSRPVSLNSRVTRGLAGWSVRLCQVFGSDQFETTNSEDRGGAGGRGQQPDPGHCLMRTVPSRCVAVLSVLPRTMKVWKAPYPSSSGCTVQR